MFSIIIGFPKMHDAVMIRNLLTANGYNVCEPCTLGSQVVSLANTLDEGIVICGFRFSDMHYSELNHFLPKGFEMLLIASPQKLEDCQDNDIVCLPLPIKTHDLLNTLQLMTYRYQKRRKQAREKPRERTEEEKQTIYKAKLILMDRNNMTEEEAHKYLQKSSMDSGTGMVEMAEMVLRLFYP